MMSNSGSLSHSHFLSTIANPFLPYIILGKAADAQQDIFFSPKLASCAFLHLLHCVTGSYGAVQGVPLVDTSDQLHMIPS